MHFRGQALVQSLIEALIRDHGLRKATKIYLSGESAGARGMMTWIDELVSSYLVTRSNDCVSYHQSIICRMNVYMSSLLKLK
jgi:hypothetical protein